VSFTREGDLHFDLRPHPLMRFRWVARPLKMITLRKLHDGPIMDDLKRRIFNRSVFIHSGDITPRWEEIERRAAAVVETAIHQPPRFAERLALKTLYPLYWIGASRKGLVSIFKGTPNYPDAPFAWNTFMQGFVLPYTRLLFASRFHRTTARAVSLYVRVRSYLTVGYMRHLHQKFRGYMIGRKQRFISLRINAQARGRLLVQRLSARRG